MRKLIILLFLITGIAYGQVPPQEFNNIRLTKLTEEQASEKVLVIDATGLIHFKNQSDIEPDLDDYYTKSEVTAILGDYLTEAEIDSLFSDYYTSDEIDDLLGNFDLQAVTDNGNTTDKRINVESVNVQANEITVANTNKYKPILLSSGNVIIREITSVWSGTSWVSGNGIALGDRAGQYNSGGNQVALGYAAGRYNSGANQAAVGYAAGQYNSGANQAVLGIYAGRYNSGDNQTALGNQAGQYNSGDYTNIIGQNYTGFEIDNAYTVVASDINNNEITIAGHGVAQKGLLRVPATINSTRYLSFEVKDANTLKVTNGDLLSNGGLVEIGKRYNRINILGYNLNPTRSNQTILGGQSIFAPESTIAEINDVGNKALTTVEWVNDKFALKSNTYTKTESNNRFVVIDGVQTIKQTKTFEESPVIPNGTIYKHAVNLEQLESVEIIAKSAGRDITLSSGNILKLVDYNTNEISQVDLSQLMTGDLSVTTDGNDIVFSQGGVEVGRINAAILLEGSFKSVELLDYKLIFKDGQGIVSGSADLEPILDLKQDNLIAGDNIELSTSNTISATDTKYTGFQGEIIVVNEEIHLAQNIKDDIQKGVTAESWGDHSVQGYATEDWSTDEFALKSHSHTIGNTTGLQTALNNKQDKLTAGDNITIAGGVISSEAGGATELVEVTQQEYQSKALYVPAFDVGSGMTYQEGSVDFGLSETGHQMGAYSFRVGIETVASGDVSVAMGHGTEALEEYSVAMGFNTRASGFYSVAMGFNTRASGDASVAMGEATEALGNYSVAMGYGTKVSEYASLAIGQFSTEGTPEAIWTPGSPIFKVGNGDSNAGRNDAYVLYNDGRSEQEGDIEVTTIGKGVVIASPDGTRFRITVANDGSLTTTEIP